MKGKASDICPKCKNCKDTTKESNGVHVWLTEVECEDPYDGMTKTLDADSNICCSMFEPKSDKSCEKCERFDGTYCHGSNGTITISYKAVFGEPVNCPSYEEKKGIEYEDPYYGLIREMSREALEAKILDLFKEKDKLNDIINKLEKEKAAHLKGIERLKNKNEKYLKKITDQQSTHYKQCARILELECAVNKLQSGEYDDILAKDIEIKSLQAKYEDVMSGWNHTMELHDRLKQESDNLAESNEKLENKVHKLERRISEEKKRFRSLEANFLTPLVHVLYPGEKVCKPYSEILEDIKLLNKGTYDLKEDNKRLVDKNKALFEENLDRLDKHTKQCQEIDNLRNELISLNTINKGLAEDRKKLINYIRSLKIASDNYLKEFTYEED